MFISIYKCSAHEVQMEMFQSGNGMGQRGRYNCTLIVTGSHVTISLYHAADCLRITHFHVAVHYYSNYLLSRMFAVVKKKYTCIGWHVGDAALQVDINSYQPCLTPFG